MKVSVLASGSKGNSTYIECNNTKILVDIGMPSSYIIQKLAEINVSPKEIDAIIITHTHIDHIYGLASFCRRYNPKIYLTKSMQEEINITSNIQYIDASTITINNLIIEIIPTSHDTSESIGFIIKAQQKELVYITDTGYINRNYLVKLKDKDMYVFESNHDIEKLMTGKYPYHLKQRILGDAGHLSNEDASRYLSKLVGGRTKGIILIHLSEENNTELIALDTLKKSLNKENKTVDTILISKQKERTELIEV
ncbi:MAG: MBL fold metallo-hydrolase [Bacilli bacterium]|nr:MBL fold metallo-hydrolase [Bacilli bacterium]